MQETKGGVFLNTVQATERSSKHDLSRLLWLSSTQWRKSHFYRCTLLPPHAGRHAWDIIYRVLSVIRLESRMGHPAIWNTVLWKLLHRFQSNFANWQRPPSTLRGWSKYAISKFKMADGRHLGKPKHRHYLNNRFADFGKIQQDDAEWVSQMHGPLKFQFLETKIAETAILKIRQIVISPQRFGQISRRPARSYGSLPPARITWAVTAIGMWGYASVRITGALFSFFKKKFRGY